MRAAVRQLASRARKHVQAARPRFIVEAAEGRRITQAFFDASHDGDTAALALLLAQDVEIHSDGGSKVLAFRNIICGLDRALRLFAGLRRKNAPTPRLLHTAEIDGLPGYVSIDRGGVNDRPRYTRRQDHRDLTRPKPRKIAASDPRYDRRRDVGFRGG